MPLSGTVWPIHFPPAVDESFTSWISRLGVYHCTVPSTFFAKTVKEKPDAWKQDLDVHCHPDILQAVSLKCCASQSTIRDSIISTYIERVYIPSDRTSSLPRWVSPARIRRKTNHHYGLKFCVFCLVESAYFKHKWRLSFYIICPDHKIRMLDSCEACGGSLSSHRIPASHFEKFPLNSLAFCDLCEFDLRLSRYEGATDREASLVSSIITIIRQSYAILGSDKKIDSHLFFQGLRLIIRGLLKLQSRGNAVYPEYSLYLPNLPANFEVEFLRVKDMREVLLIAHELLHDWPSTFIQFSEANKLFFQDWIRPRDLAPAWFSSVVNIFHR